jgi:hypothetical protein
MSVNNGFYIRKNTPYLQERLKSLGYAVCPCIKFSGAVWLDVDLRSNSVHGVGYPIEYPSGCIGQELAFFEQDTNSYDCDDDEELFIEMAENFSPNREPLTWQAFWTNRLG